MSTQSTFDGYVATSAPSAPRRPVQDFLAAIDPKDLEQAALEHMGGLCGPSTGEAFLLALKQMAEEFDGS